VLYYYNNNNNNIIKPLTARANFKYQYLEI